MYNITFIHYEQKVSAVMVNNSTNINKKKKHLNLLNTKKTMIYNVYLSNIYKYISFQVNKVLGYYVTLII
jgi:hypothetical protein